MDYSNLFVENTFDLMQLNLKAEGQTEIVVHQKIAFRSVKHISFVLKIKFLICVLS